MGSREEQKEKRRQDILAAALDLFVTNGYKETKITDIARKVSMSTGLLFHYFESKEILYTELVKIGLEGTRYPLQTKYDDAITYFEKFTKELFQIMKQQPFVAKMFVLMAAAQKSEGTPEKVREIAMQVDTMERFIPIIEQGQVKGTIREGDPRALSIAYWCSIQGIAEQYARYNDIPVPEAEWIVDIVRGERK